MKHGDDEVVDLLDKSCVVSVSSRVPLANVDGVVSICLILFVAALSAWSLPSASFCEQRPELMSSFVAWPLTLLQVIEFGPRAMMHFIRVRVRSPCFACSKVCGGCSGSVFICQVTVKS